MTTRLVSFLIMLIVLLLMFRCVVYDSIDKTVSFEKARLCDILPSR